jgi:hypothetical protein
VDRGHSSISAIRMHITLAINLGSFHWDQKISNLSTTNAPITKRNLIVLKQTAVGKVRSSQASLASAGNKWGCLRCRAPSRHEVLSISACCGSVDDTSTHVDILLAVFIMRDHLEYARNVQSPGIIGLFYLGSSLLSPTYARDLYSRPSTKLQFSDTGL